MQCVFALPPSMPHDKPRQLNLPLSSQSHPSRASSLQPSTIYILLHQVSLNACLWDACSHIGLDDFKACTNSIGCQGLVVMDALARALIDLNMAIDEVPLRSPAPVPLLRAACVVQALQVTTTLRPLSQDNTVSDTIQAACKSVTKALGETL